MNKTIITSLLALPTLLACSAASRPTTALAEPKVADAPGMFPAVTQQETVAFSDAACEDDTLCALAGLCSARGADCVAGDDRECLQSQQCLTDGACSANNGECVASSDDECSRSEACIREGRCTARDGYCSV